MCISVYFICWPVAVAWNALMQMNDNREWNIWFTFSYASSIWSILELDTMFNHTNNNFIYVQFIFLVMKLNNILNISHIWFGSKTNKHYNVKNNGQTDRYNIQCIWCSMEHLHVIVIIHVVWFEFKIQMYMHNKLNDNMQNWIANVQSKLEKIFIAKGTRNKKNKKMLNILYMNTVRMMNKIYWYDNIKFTQQTNNVN